jgi:hypothetical protein
MGALKYLAMFASLADEACVGRMQRLECAARDLGALPFLFLS